MSCSQGTHVQSALELMFYVALWKTWGPSSTCCSFQGSGADSYVEVMGLILHCFIPCITHNTSTVWVQGLFKAVPNQIGCILHVLYTSVRNKLKTGRAMGPPLPPATTWSPCTTVHNPQPAPCLSKQPRQCADLTGGFLSLMGGSAPPSSPIIHILMGKWFAWCMGKHQDHRVSSEELLARQNVDHKTWVC